MKTLLLMLFAAVTASSGCFAAAAPKSADPAKVLIAYYSWSGNTRAMADQIKEITGGTLFEIKPKNAYPEDNRACVDQAKKEIREGFRPELVNAPLDLSKYDVIFVGTPNWWGTMAPPVATFLASNSFEGKTVIPFATHGGGGMQSCEKDIAAAVKGNVMPAKTVYGSSVRSSEAEITQWVNSILSIKK